VIKEFMKTGWDVCGFDVIVIKDNLSPQVWWTLMISLWYPIVIFSILPIVSVGKHWRISGKYQKRIHPNEP